MANIVITSTTDSIKIDFGDCFIDGKIRVKEAYFGKSKLIANNNDAYVELFNGVDSFDVSFDGNNGWQVDTINAVAPTSNSDLAAKLSVLIKA